MFNSKKLKFLISLILFRLSLDLSYVFFISKNFEYDGFYLNFDWFSYVFSHLALLFYFLITPSSMTKVSDYFFITFITCLIIPQLSLHGLDFNRGWEALFGTTIFLLIAYLITNAKFTSIRYPSFKNSEQLIVFFMGALVVLSLINYVLSGARMNFDLVKVYEFRDENKELAAQGIFAYFNVWVYKVVNIFLIGYFLFKKKYLLVLAFCLAQVLFFSFSAHKAVLFAPLLVFGLWFYFRRSKSLLIVPLAFSGLVLLLILIDFISGKFFFNALITRRVFFVPAHLTDVYFDFFSNNQFIFWSNSILSSFISYPYNTSVSHVIGGYLGKPDMAANNGAAAMGFAHAGWFGVILYAILCSMILRLSNKLSSSGLPLWLALSILIVPLRTLILSSDLFTTILSHGLFIAILVLFFLSNIQNENVSKQ